jgi:hypothetical protein
MDAASPDGVALIDDELNRTRQARPSPALESESPDRSVENRPEVSAEHILLVEDGRVVR